MKVHSFIEYKSGKYELVKKFLHLTGHDQIDMGDLDNWWDETRTMTIMTKEGDAQKLAFNLLRKMRRSAFEGYDISSKDDRILYRDVPNICTVSDIDTANVGLSNFLYAFIYPLKYKEYRIFRLDYNIQSRERYLMTINHSLKHGRDEIIISDTENVRRQMRYN